MHELRSRPGVIACAPSTLLLLVVAIFASSLEPRFSEASERLTPIVRAVRDARPAVVNIQGQKSISETVEGTLTSPRQVNGMGTGVVIDSRGYILTNHHVVDGVKRINTTLAGGQTYVAKIVAYDKKSDLAIIRIRTPSPLPVIHLGTSEDLMAGETVVAVGNAFGYEHTVTTGIVSALHRNVQVNESQQYLDLIQTDASINPGNSGGPLLNIDGEMIGVNVAVRAGAQGIGFAIPVDKALEIATRLLSIEKLDNHWHGMTALALDGPTGPVTVARMDRESPAERSGLKRGDQLERIGNTDIHRPMDVERALLGRPRGQRIPLVVRRENETLQLDLNLARRSPNRFSRQSHQATNSQSSKSVRLAEAAWETLGLKLRAEPSSTFRKLGVPYRGGMQVVSVRAGSSAAKQGVQAGDLLVKMHRWTTVTEKDLRFIVERADTLARAGQVKFYVVRGEETFFGHMSVARRSQTLR
ncbi:MAG: trypsin-like peptidase domain-containing protein [Pirellulales bacterium]|nr:trypsin-like peptidase domain-containing protein [Pirellulales bacterium]